MIDRLERAGLLSVYGFVGVATIVFVGRGLRFGADVESWPPLHPLAPWEALLVWPSLVMFAALTAATTIGRWLAPLVASYHEGRALFVHRIVAGRDRLLLERITRLESLLAHTAVRDGVLHARGLEIEDAEGAPILTVEKSDRGVTTLTVGGESRRTAAALVVTERGAAIELRDGAGRLRFRAAVNRDDVWATLHNAKEDPRAGFIVAGGIPRLLLDEPVGKNTRGGDGQTPGYL